MLSDICRISSIYYDFPFQHIMMRLGGSVKDSVQCSLVESTSRELYQNCIAQGQYGTLEITKIEKEVVLFSDGFLINSPSVARALEGGKRALIFCVTIGNLCHELTMHAFEEGEAAKAMILDATGSECVEYAVHSLQLMLRQQFLRFGWNLSNTRFSCGYGGWALSDQAQYFRWLPLEEMGVSLSEGGILQPEKTVTAIAKIS